MKLLKFFVGLLVIPSGLGLIFYSLEKNKFFDLDSVELIVQETPESPQFLRPLIKKLEDSLKIYHGQSVWSIDLQKISSEVSQNSWIANYKIIRRFPSTLQLTIEPRALKLLYMSKGGKLLPVVEDGSFLEAVDPRLAPDLPLLVGEEFYDKLELRKKSVNLMEEIPDEGSFSKKSISEIRFDHKDGFWMTLIKDGIKVKMGEEKINLKSARVGQVIDYMEARDFQPRVIDANLSKKVLVRLRKDP